MLAFLLTSTVVIEYHIIKLLQHLLWGYILHHIHSAGPHCKQDEWNTVHAIASLLANQHIG